MLLVPRWKQKQQHGLTVLTQPSCMQTHPGLDGGTFSQSFVLDMLLIGRASNRNSIAEARD